MRPVLHFTPRRGWMNDPNGLIHHGELHHLFYQTNPTSTEFGQIHWGHATSSDLLTWTERPVALSPDQDYDSHGCWSGAAIDDDGRIAVLYSGNDGSAYQRPSLAWATDDSLDHWKKDPANPVIADPPALTERVTAFRDHSITRRPDGTWRQLIGGATGRGGAVFSYTSTDLRCWTYTGLFAEYTTVPFSAPIWECPDSFTVDDHTALIISGLDPGAAGERHADVSWALGHDNGETLAVERTGLVDHGDRFYAPQSYWTRDGRRIMFGWIRTQADPVVAGQPWVGAMSLPRELTIRGGTLMLTPAREVLAAHGAATITECAAGSTVTDAIPPHRVAFVVEIPIELITAALTLVLHGGGHEHAISVAPLLDGRAVRDTLTVYVDAGIVEAFHDGRAATWTTGPVVEVSSLTIRHDRAIGPRRVIFRALGSPERATVGNASAADEPAASTVGVE